MSLSLEKVKACKYGHRNKETEATLNYKLLSDRKANAVCKEFSVVRALSCIIDDDIYVSIYKKRLRDLNICRSTEERGMIAVAVKLK